MSMRHRLKLLLHRWAEMESIRSAGHGLRIPDAKFVWVKDKLGNWHRGSYDGRGNFIPNRSTPPRWDYGKRLEELASDAGADYLLDGDDAFKNFIPLQASFVLIPGTTKREDTDAEEFGVVLRTLDEIDQGLVIMAEFGGEKGWKDYLVEIKLAPRRANLRLKQAWLVLAIECRRRGLA